ncbi:MAG: chorismate mutase [Actinomycetota bacterium]
MSRLRGLRGATSVKQDTEQEVVDATVELVRTMMGRNSLEIDDLVTIIFTATPDITSQFPAYAARSIGISDIPLLCATEMDVKAAPPRIIRVLMHIYTDKGYKDLRHVYLREARGLRTDLPQ